MPANTNSDPPKEFLVVSLPDDAKAGMNLRLLDVKPTLNAAEKAVAVLDAAILGRVAVLERKALFVRRPAVENTTVNDPISKI